MGYEYNRIFFQICVDYISHFSWCIFNWILSVGMFRLFEMRCHFIRKYVLSKCIESLQFIFPISIKTVGYVAKERDMYCELCYHTLFGEKCNHCSEVITGDYIEALGGVYHSHHFVCYSWFVF